MVKNRLKELSSFLHDWTYNSTYSFLEEGKDDKELETIAEKRGVQVSSHDLAFFKCIYAMVDQKNKNGCTLPKEEVEKALPTLVGKAIDIDHFRKRTVGFWLDNKIEEDKIIAYGAFWKSNFSEEYEDIKKLMEKGKLKVSFESWGDRVYKGSDKRNYDLTNIELAGGALLFATEPAFSEAEVLEFSNKKILEMASVLTPPSTFVHETGEKESSQYYDWEMDHIMRIMNEVECPSCKSSAKKIDMIDFENSKVKATCLNCGAKFTVDLEPDVTINKKGKKIKEISLIKPEKTIIMKIEDIKTLLENSTDEVIVSRLEDFEGSEEDLDVYFSSLEGENIIDEEEKEIEKAKKLKYEEKKALNDDSFAAVVTVKNKKSGEPQKIRMFPIHDLAYVRNALARLGQTGTQATLKKLGASIDTVKRKILKRARQLKMTDLLKCHEEGKIELLLEKYQKSSLEELAQFLDTELEAAKAAIGTKDGEIASLKTDTEQKIKNLTMEKEAIQASLKTKEDAEKANVIKIRKEQLGDFGKDISDEDILNDLKFENALLKKQLAEKDPAKASQFVVGSKDKDQDTTTFTIQSRIQDKAFRQEK